MQIRKLTIYGFKSFGTKKELIFEDGITAVVGPNGSGKSNIADAIRWVLGEHKSSRMRATKQEDVIFYGTKKVPRASMAEVSILFDNSSGVFPLSASEVQISRKLLRSGDSEYRLNGKKAKHIEVEELLTRAGFGLQSYTVVGQGMVDQLITATGQERQLLFEEASGVRQYDIKRQNAQKSLKRTSQDLANISSVIQELAPTIKLLEKQKDNEHKRQALQTQLLSMRKQYIALTLKQINDEQAQAQKTYAKNSTALELINRDIEALRHEYKSNQNDVTNTSKSNEQTLRNLKQKLQTYQLQEQDIQVQIAQYTHDAKKGSAIEHNLATKESQLANYTKKEEQHTLKVNTLQQRIDEIARNLTKQEKSLRDIQRRLQNSPQQVLAQNATAMVQSIRVELRKDNSLAQVDTMLRKLSDMLQLISADNAYQLIQELNHLQNTINKLMASREELVEKQTNEVIVLRSIELDIAGCNQALLVISKQQEQLTKSNKQREKLQKSHQLMQDKISHLVKQIDALEDQTNSSQDRQPASVVQTMTRLEELTTKRVELEHTIQAARQVLSEVVTKQKELDGYSKRWSLKTNDDVLRLPRADAGKVSLADIMQLEAQLDAIETIDNGLLHEAEATFERVEFLQSQKQDLEAALTDSQKLIDTLQNDMKKQFQKAFTRINKSFQQHFQALFDGGSAELVLSQAEPEQFGIDILVSPPGKRLLSINTLSGGEKAMTAIALLSAILQNNPSPFVLLDEVDAALDDDNSHKFTQIVKTLSRSSQLIIITHNHETMSSAQNIFGITSSIKGDSEVIPFSLQQAVTTIKS